MEKLPEDRLDTSYFGYINRNNVDYVAARIRATLYGRLFSVASCFNFDSPDPFIKLVTNVQLVNKWNDSQELVRVFKDSNYMAIRFHAGEMLYSLESQWDGESNTVCTHLNPEYANRSTDTYVNFFRDSGFMLIYRAPSGNLCQLTFCVQGPIPTEPVRQHRCTR